MKIRTGNPVRGENFFVRKHLIDKVWERIESGYNLLLVAPRRVGKTSLMFYLMDNPKENYNFLFINVESVTTENEFYRRLLSNLVSSEFVKFIYKSENFIKEHLPIIKKIGPDGVTFDTKDNYNFHEAFDTILKRLNLKDKKLIILLDEFSEATESIRIDYSDRDAIHFLHTNREIRLSDKINNVQFIYSGSIGLENIVKKINATHIIDDITPLKIEPLRKEEAFELISLLLETVSFKLSVSSINYILEKIKWLIPFYIQLILQSLKDLSKEKNVNVIDEKLIDEAFSVSIENINQFELWHTRLRKSLKKNEYNFAKELLNIISEKETIESNEIYDLAIKHDLEDDYKDIVASLVYDGYINNNDEVKIYRYNSPILRMWWWKYVTN